MTPPDRDPARMHDDDLPEEPRVPGGPLAIGGLHPLAWIFILLALVDLVWFIVNSDSAQITSLADAVFYGLQVFPAVAAILFPAALLARHPDAATRAPVLLLGTVLFAIVQFLLLLATPLAPYFEASTPASEEVPFIAMAEVFNGLTLLVAAIALGFMARGLSLARWYEDRLGGWIDWLVPLATAFAVITAVLLMRLLIEEAPPASVVLISGFTAFWASFVWRHGRICSPARCAASRPVRTQGPAGSSPRWPAGSSWSRSC